MSEAEMTGDRSRKSVHAGCARAAAGWLVGSVAVACGALNLASVSYAQPSARSPSRQPVAALRALPPDREAIRWQSSATGFFVDDTGHMLTARHAVENCARVVVAKEGRAAAARVVALSPRVDLALLKVPRTWGLAAVFPRTATASANELVFAAAYDTLPGIVGRGSVIANATVAASLGDAEAGHLALNSQISFGGSGAPVLDGRGLVEGVVSRRSMFNRVLAVGANEAKSFLASNALHVAQDDRPQIAGSGSRANRAASLSARISCFRREG